jgi:hypothetical protein
VLLEWMGKERRREGGREGRLHKCPHSQTLPQPFVCYNKQREEGGRVAAAFGEARGGSQSQGRAEGRKGGDTVRVHKSIINVCVCFD